MLHPRELNEISKEIVEYYNLCGNQGWTFQLTILNNLIACGPGQDTSGFFIYCSLQNFVTLRKNVLHVVQFSPITP